MAQFYGEVQGGRGATSRLGGKDAGIRTTAAGWRGAIKVRTWHDDEGDCDRFEVRLTPWKNSGGHERIIAEGVLDVDAKTWLGAERVLIEKEAA